jgi:multisubunit Na+/H+ antiporter MnhB subunit
MRLHAGALLLAVALAAALIWAALLPPAGRVQIAVQLAPALPLTGAANPVTGVLLGFRAYDTLLEIAVLLLAVLGARSVRPSPGVARPHRPAASSGPVLRALVNLLVPVMMLVAGYFLWVGTHAPGGAFQAAAVLGAAGVLMRLAGVLPALDPDRVPVRAALAGGLALFLALLVANALAAMLLVLETVLTVSIGIALLCLFAAPQR